MRTAIRSFAVVAAVGLTGTINAQTMPTPGATPGTGARVIDLSNPAPAESLGDPSAGPWVVVAPYVWVYGMKGTVGVGQRTAEVDASVGDALSAAGKLEGAAQLHIEGGYGPFGVLTDLTYQRLKPTDNRLFTLDSRSTILELLGTYRAVDTGGGRAGGVTLDVLGGARYYSYSNQLAGNLRDLFVAERSNKWIDLVVGARAGLQVTDDLGVFSRGDIGGFGLGNSSRLASNVTVGFEYRICDCASLMGGYRWLKIDRENGLGRDRFVLDVTMGGPFVAFGLRF